MYNIVMYQTLYQEIYLNLSFIIYQVLKFHWKWKVC